MSAWDELLPLGNRPIHVVDTQYDKAREVVNDALAAMEGPDAQSLWVNQGEGARGLLVILTEELEAHFQGPTRP